MKSLYYLAYQFLCEIFEYIDDIVAIKQFGERLYPDGLRVRPESQELRLADPSGRRPIHVEFDVPLTRQHVHHGHEHKLGRYQ